MKKKCSYVSNVVCGTSEISLGHLILMEKIVGRAGVRYKGKKKAVAFGSGGSGIWVYQEAFA